MVLALLAVIVVLVVVGGSIRAFSRHEEPGVDPSALTGLTPAWSADLGQGRVVGIAFEADRLYASSAQGLTVFDIPCDGNSDGDGEPCRPSWLGVVPDGPISAPVVSGDSVYAGSSSGQVYAFPATCDANGCPPRWVGVAGKGRVSRPGVNDDFVYVTSDRLYAFPSACGSADRTCLPAWSTPLPDPPTGDAPAVGGGVVVVASDSVEGGVSAFPAVCTEGCEPLWTGDTDGPATGVTIEDDTAYVVAHGSLLAFPLSCQGACHPTWTGTFVPGGAFAEGSPAPPGVGSGQVAIAGDDGTLWLFPATCPNPTCGPLRSFDLGVEGLGQAGDRGGHRVRRVRGRPRVRDRHQLRPLERDHVRRSGHDLAREPDPSRAGIGRRRGLHGRRRRHRARLRPARRRLASVGQATARLIDLVA